MIKAVLKPFGRDVDPVPTPHSVPSPATAVQQLRRGVRSALLVAALTPLTSHAQTPACPASTDSVVASGWRAYRADSAAVALGRFAEARRLCPANMDAAVGAGFAALRVGRVVEAESAFVRVTRATPSYGDAWDGLAIVRNRQGDVAGAVAAWRRVVAIDPANTSARANLDRLAPDWERAATPPVRRRSATLDVTMRVRGTAFELRRGDTWEPFYVKGVNMGLALPGRFPAEFSPDSSLYARWFDRIREMNANTMRVYTILPPAFYRALRAHNLAHPDGALRVIHGVWTELPPHDDFDDREFNAEYQAEIRHVVDLLHGAAVIAPQPGHASGVYDADVSPWVIGYIIGREWEPYSPRRFNDKVGKNRSYHGRFMVIDNASPTDVWMVTQCDRLMDYEVEAYNAQRPIAYTNWPTTDAIVHPTETTYSQQMQFRGLKYEADTTAGPEVNEEGVSLDASLAHPTAANIAGWFASYHAYPYYPDFLLYDPGYNQARSSRGRSNYFGYLQELIRHHAGIPVLISEFGIPSSRGVSHLQPQGWNHGGLDEAQVAVADVRLAEDIKEAGAAGAIVFAWIDEWFKRSWLTMDFQLPAERGRLWHNMLSSEQHYGVVALRPGAPGTTPEPGGDAARWHALPVLESGLLVGHDTSLVRVGKDEGFVYIAIETPKRAGRAFPWDSLSLQLAIDTYRGDLGQFILPTSGLRSSIGFEFLVEIRSPKDAELRVAPDYNPYMTPWLAQGGAHFGEHFRRPVWSGRRLDGVFDSLWTLTNRPRYTNTGALIPGQGINLGRLRYGTAAASSLADWFYDERTATLELRLPWAMLNVSDPSSRRVLFESDIAKALDPSIARSRSLLTGVPTDGFHIGVVALRRGPELAGTIPALTPFGDWPVEAFPLWSWTTWDEPTWHEYLKPVYFALQQLWRTP